MPRILFALLALAAFGCGGAPPNPRTDPPPIDGSGGDAEDAPPMGERDEDSPPPAVEPSPPPKPKTEAPPAKVAEPTPPAKVEEKKKGGLPVVVGVALLAVWLGLRFGYTGEMTPPMEFLQHLTVFVLACFVGWQVIWSVSAALHTPLMAVTNAISGIIIVGGLLQAKGSWDTPSALLGGAAVLLATINIAGGFLVTQRMLKMFRK